MDDPDSVATVEPLATDASMGADPLPRRGE